MHEKFPSFSLRAVEEEDSFKSFSSSKTDSVDIVRVREAVAKLRAAGVPNAAECLRIGAAVMADRCLAKYHERQPDVEPGWLAAAVRRGDAFPNLAPGLPERPRRETASDWLREIHGVTP
jgi:hypothetical protein